MTIVFGDKDRDTERFRLTLTDDFSVFDTVQSLATYLDLNPAEDLVIVGPDAAMTVATDIAERYRVERPRLGVILMRRRVEVQTMTEALRSGIREVVGADDAAALLAACSRSKQVSQQMLTSDLKAVEVKKGKIILVYAAKGGSGKTTLATNLAAVLADLDVGRVCLVDFNLEFGDVAIALQVEPVRTISAALGMQGGLDIHGVASMVIPYKERFDVLLAPTQPADAEFITSALTTEILTLLRGIYDFVIIDSPAAFNDVVLKSFDLADSYVLLTTLDMLALKNFKVTLDTLDALGYPRSRWSVVLNRCDSRVGLTPEDMEQIIGMPIQTRLPSTKDVPASLNKGVTLATEDPKNPFSHAVAGLARLESDGLGGPDSQSSKAKRSLFRRRAGE